MTDDKADRLITAIENLGADFRSGVGSIMVQPNYTMQQEQKQMVQEMKMMFDQFGVLLIDFNQNIKEDRALKLTKETQEEELYNPFCN